GADRTDGPVTVETYQWFVRNAGRISDAYSIVICDEAHTALGDKTSAAIRAWTGPIFVGMTATGALIARHVTDLFPTQTSRFDLAQAARRGVIAPLRSIRIPPGPGVRTIAKVPLRKGDVDIEFDQEMLAELLDQLPFNSAIANLYKTRFNGVPGVVYAAGVRHAMNVAEAFRAEGIKAMGVSGETPKRELAEILARYERGDIDVLVNAQLLAEGWNSPRATICMHLAPTASKRIYQQRVGRVTRRHPGKESGIVVDFVHPATRHDDPVVTLHSLLDREVYRGGAIVVGPVRRGRGRRVRVERRVIPVCADEDRRIEVFERELWRIAVEFLDYGEQVQWAALAGARVAPSGWRRARAMLHFDKSGELKRSFLLTAVERNKNTQLRLRALQEIAQSRDADAFERAVDVIRTWSRDERREGVKILLQALAERRIGRRDQASHWIWDLADMTREVHEEYAVQRWPETKRLLGLLVNSSGGAHARNARRLVHAARKQDRRLSAAILAAAVAHTPEAMEVVRGARTRMARKPSALSRELLRNFPKRKNRSRRRRKKGDDVKVPQLEAVGVAVGGAELEEGAVATATSGGDAAQNGNGNGGSGDSPKKRRRSRSRRNRAAAQAAAAGTSGDDNGAASVDDLTAEAAVAETDGQQPAQGGDGAGTSRSSRRRRRRQAAPPVDDAEAARAIASAAASVHQAAGTTPAASASELEPAADPASPPADGDPAAADTAAEAEQPKPKRARRTPVAKAAADAEAATDPVAGTPVADATPAGGAEGAAPAEGVGPADGAGGAVGAGGAEGAAPKPKARARRAPVAAQAAAEVAAPEAEAPKPKPRARRTPVANAAPVDGAAPAGAEVAEDAPKPRARRAAKAAATTDADAPAAGDVAEEAAAPKPRARRAPAAKSAAATEVPAEDKPKRKPRKTAAAKAAEDDAGAEPDAKPKRKRAAPKKAADADGEKPKPRARRTTAKAAAAESEQLSLDGTAAGEEPKPKPRRTTRRKAAEEPAPEPATPADELDAA
ncbi:MAG: ribonuclease, partial [Baekduia sp.]|nr:ribonuclease [Baekduia sp.]